MIKSLCQDCLRIILIPTFESIDNDRPLKCICGGELCYCDDCIKKTESWKQNIFKDQDFTPEFNKIRKGKKLNWTAKHGIRIDT